MAGRQSRGGTCPASGQQGSDSSRLWPPGPVSCPVSLTPRTHRKEELGKSHVQRPGAEGGPCMDLQAGQSLAHPPLGLQEATWRACCCEPKALFLILESSGMGSSAQQPRRGPLAPLPSSCPGAQVQARRRRDSAPPAAHAPQAHRPPERAAPADAPSVSGRGGAHPEVGVLLKPTHGHF